MATQFYRPWQVQSRKLSTGVITTSDGQVLEAIRDERAGVTKNQMDSHRWRKPSSYERYINEGDTNSFSLVGNFSVPNLKTVTRTGAANASGSYLALLPPVPQHMRDGCIQRCLEKLKSGDFNAAQNAAERKQVADMTRNYLDKMREDCNDRRKRFSHRGFKSRDLASLYLELVYGWRPLLSDVHSAVELLSKREEDEEYFVTVKASRREGFYVAREVSEVVDGVTWQVKSSFRGNHHCKVRLDYVKNNAPLVAFSQLGLTNPLYLAWELTPYSFVADWFLPVGKYLNILDADYGWTFKGGSMSRITRGSQRPYSADVHPMHAGAGITGKLYASGKSYQMFFRRDAYAESPLPAKPHLDSRANAEHVFNGIALFRIALNRLFL